MGRGKYKGERAKEGTRICRNSGKLNCKRKNNTQLNVNCEICRVSFRSGSLCCPLSTGKCVNLAYLSCF